MEGGSTKNDTMITWTKNNENVCIDIVNRSEAFVWLLNETATYYDRLNTIFNLIIVIGTYLFGSSGIPTLFIESKTVDLRYFNLVIQISVIIIGIISTILKPLNFGGKSSNYNIASFRYSILVRDIKKELNKNKSDRNNFNTFYEKIGNEEAELKHDYMIIPEMILKKYYKKFGKNAISYGDLFSDKIIISQSDGLNKQVFDLVKYV